MAIYANLSTITTQTIPLIIVDPATVTADQVLQWDTTLGAFIAKAFTIPDNSVFDFSKLNFIGELSVEHGGTGLNAVPAGSLLVGGATSSTLDIIPPGVSNNKQVLSIQNDNVNWIDITEVKGNTAHISELFSTTSITLSDPIPAESYISQITITIREAYDAESLISVTNFDESISFIDNDVITANIPGVYVFKVDEYIDVETVIKVKLENAALGSGKITIEFNLF
jgi:hypothetical protein